MKKSDLKDGMVVELRKGTRLMLINDYLHNEMHEYNFNNYNEYLIHHRNVNILDIVKVYIIDISNIKEMFKSIKLKDMLADEFLKLIWEREKEVDWSKVPVGTIVKVSDDKIEWFNAYFIKKSSPITAFYVISAEGKLSDWSYCKLAEKPKEEVTVEKLETGLKQFCTKKTYDYHGNCDCKYGEKSCEFKWLLDNYNVTRKDNK